MEGKIDIVVGTHALLGPKVEFKKLGLVVIDEEQHFGVVHKERLKKLRAEVHVLTMTATPIPRTLQMALGGLKELSLIATPPVDRLGGPRLRSARRSRRYPGSDPSRALPRRPELLCLSSGSRIRDKLADQLKTACAGDQGRRRQWADGGKAARRGDGGVLRSQDRSAALHQHHRIRASTFRPPTPSSCIAPISVRPFPALPAPRSRRAQAR